MWCALAGSREAVGLSMQAVMRIVVPTVAQTAGRTKLCEIPRWPILTKSTTSRFHIYQ